MCLKDATEWGKRGHPCGRSDAGTGLTSGEKVDDGLWCKIGRNQRINNCSSRADSDLARRRTGLLIGPSRLRIRGRNLARQRDTHGTKVDALLDGSNVLGFHCLGEAVEGDIG